MNDLIWEKEIEMCNLCEKKCDEIAKKYPFKYCYTIFKAGRMWNYYMSLWTRTTKGLKALIKT